MPEFTEGNLAFEFDDRWTVEKYDDHRDYRDRIARLAETKAVDFVGFFRGDTAELWWIEVKDFRGSRLGNKPKLDSGILMVEVAQKVRDSIAGIMGAYRTSSEPELWQPFVRALRDRQCRIKVLLWLEEDLPRRPQGRQHNRAQVLASQLKNQLVWLTTKVLVGGHRLGGQPEGCRVANLPGAGQGK